jgi:two-component system capsular synthesis sensor histidine kinase RcsC
MIPDGAAAHSGVRVCRYEGQTPDADDMLITDEMPEQPWRGEGGDLLPSSYRYSASVRRGMAAQRATPHELLPLLARLTSAAGRRDGAGACRHRNLWRREMTI